MPLQFWPSHSLKTYYGFRDAFRLPCFNSRDEKRIIFNVFPLIPQLHINIIRNASVCLLPLIPHISDTCRRLVFKKPISIKHLFYVRLLLALVSCFSTATICNSPLNFFDCENNLSVDTVYISESVWSCSFADTYFRSYHLTGVLFLSLPSKKTTAYLGGLDHGLLHFTWKSDRKSCLL